MALYFFPHLQCCRLDSLFVERLSIFTVFVCPTVLSSIGTTCTLRARALFLFQHIKHDASVFKGSSGSSDLFATQMTTMTTASSSERISVCNAHQDQASTNLTSLYTPKTLEEA